MVMHSGNSNGGKLHIPCSEDRLSKTTPPKLMLRYIRMYIHSHVHLAPILPAMA